MQVPRKQRQIRTGDYSPDARLRLGQAVAQARTAAGYPYRTDLVDAVKAAGGKLSIRSLQALEAGDASVGQSVLFAVARLLPNWDEDTPRIVLEAGPIPPTLTPVVRLGPSANYDMAPYEWSAESRQKILAMDMADVLDFAQQVLATSGDRAVILWLQEAIRLKAEALAIESAASKAD